MGRCSEGDFTSTSSSESSFGTTKSGCFWKKTKKKKTKKKKKKKKESSKFCWKVVSYFCVVLKIRRLLSYTVVHTRFRSHFIKAMLYGHMYLFLFFGLFFQSTIFFFFLSFFSSKTLFIIRNPLIDF